MLSKLTTHGLRLRAFHSHGLLTQMFDKLLDSKFNENNSIKKPTLFRETSSVLRYSIRTTTDWCKRQNASNSTNAAAEREPVVRCNNEKGVLEVTWTGEEVEKFPFVWLRDNCQCEKCHHPISHARNLYMKDLNLQDQPADIQVDNARNSIKITWSDGHRSEYDLSWLDERRFHPENQRKHAEDTRRTQLYKPQRHMIKSINFNDIINKDESLYAWITEIEMNGICLVTDAASKNDQIDVLAQRVAFMRKTAIGTVQSVKAMKSPNNPTYTSAYLPLHTDHPYYFNVPGIQMIHCLTNITEGGDSLFADGFYAANIMREKYPELFHVLSTTPINYCDVGKHFFKFDKLTEHLMFGLDEKGELSKVVFSNGRRDSKMTAPLEKVQLLYAGMKIFNQLIHDKENTIQIKLGPGEMMCWNNHRYLHGRVGFRLTGDGVRHLETGYIDWDEMRSRRRVIAKELGLTL